MFIISDTTPISTFLVQYLFFWFSYVPDTSWANSVVLFSVHAGFKSFVFSVSKAKILFLFAPFHRQVRGQV